PQGRATLVHGRQSIVDGCWCLVAASTSFPRSGVVRARRGAEPGGRGAAAGTRRARRTGGQRRGPVRRVVVISSPCSSQINRLSVPLAMERSSVAVTYW